MGGVDPIFGQVGHGMKLDGTGAHGERVADRPAAPAAAADQCQADRVVFSGMHARHARAGKQRAGGGCPAELDRVAA